MFSSGQKKRAYDVEKQLELVVRDDLTKGWLMACKEVGADLRIAAAIITDCRLNLPSNPDYLAVAGYTRTADIADLQPDQADWYKGQLKLLQSAKLLASVGTGRVAPVSTYCMTPEAKERFEKLSKREQSKAQTAVERQKVAESVTGLLKGIAEKGFKFDGKE